MREPVLSLAHRALLTKVDAFDEDVRARRSDDMQCKAGCCACCRDQLTVCDVEASLLREGTDAMTATATERLEGRVMDFDASSPCVFLEDDGRCAVYASRPMVCRTQGLPLRYPAGVLADEAAFARTAEGDDVTWCPLNFTLAQPRANDVLDAARVDRMVGLSNQAAGGEPDRRTSLLDLARRAVAARR